MADLHVVTGAFSFTGRHIAQRLLGSGHPGPTPNRHPNRPNPLGDRLEVGPLDFQDHARLVEDQRGARSLYNTYWVRFPHGDVTYEGAVENSRRLFAAAAEAGVGRVVHISITNPSTDSPLPYF